MYKNIVCFGIVLVLMALVGCQTGPNIDNLLESIAKVPMPPGVNGFTTNGDESTSSFYISAKCTDMTQEEVIDFYTIYFQENGWKNELPPDEQIDGMLLFAKGHESMDVTLLQLDNQLHLMVNYSEFDHTREDFYTLVNKSATPEALAVIDKIKTSYTTLTSYRDTGILREKFDNGNMSTNATFSTEYVAPDRLRFNYSEDPDDFFPKAYNLLVDGEVVTKMSSFDDSPEIGNDASLAIAALYGVTRTTSGSIPNQLLKLDSSLFYLIHLTVLKEATVDDGTVCIRLQGIDFVGEETTLWIGKEDYLIRKVESHEENGDFSTITYHPEINVDLDDSIFKFIPPTEP